MKYLSLFALCTVLALITGCGRNQQNGPCCTPTTTRVAQEAEPAGAVEVQEEAVEVERPQPAPVSDKEDLMEAELEEVMTTK